MMNARWLALALSCGAVVLWIAAVWLPGGRELLVVCGLASRRSPAAYSTGIAAAATSAGARHSGESRNGAHTARRRADPPSLPGKGPGVRSTPSPGAEAEFLPEQAAHRRGE